MKYPIAFLAIAACAYATPTRTHDRHRSRALYNLQEKTTPTVALETTTANNTIVAPSRGELVSPESSESFKTIMALADITRRVYEFVSNANLGRLFSIEGFRSISYVLVELAPLVLGPYSGIIRVLLSPLIQNATESLQE